jgi:hemerythrin-like domain-containing protein
MEQLKGGDLAAAGRIRYAMRRFARMLRRHILREEEIVFLLSEALLSEDEWAEIRDQFATIDAAADDASFEKAAELVLRIEELNRDPS